MDTTPVHEPPARLTRTPSWLINQVAIIAGRVVGERFAGEGTGGRYEYSLLASLAEYGPSSQAELGRRGRIDRSDVVAKLNALGEQGYVERATDPADRRRNIVTITPAGLAYLDRLDTMLAEAADEILAPLSTVEREALIGMLIRVREHHLGPPSW